MASDIDRKELPLTRHAIERASAQERLLYGGLVKQLRKDRGLTQGQLQERSGVTSRTIRNIELEEKAGQSDNLIRLFTALDIDLDGSLWGVDVQKYTAMLAPLIRDIAPDHRLGAVSEVIPVLSRAIAAHPNVAAVDAAGATVTPIRASVGTPTEDDIHVSTPPNLTDRKAAKRGTRKADQ